mgnify:CR=1 FL=1|tara:strand:- start:512 stop:940 length:429 start_codon:yes stop_codon:yes gene_type:complete
MSKSKFAAVILFLVIVLVIITINNFNDNSYTASEDILKQIEFDAVYLKNDHIVQVSFNDKSNNTKSAILEILGMDVTYHQEYVFTNNSNFTEKMKLEDIPKYGWETTPVTLEIKHSEFGNIGLKTEIYEPGQLKPRVIVEQR